MTYTLPERNTIIDQLWDLQVKHKLPVTTVVGKCTANLELELNKLRKQLGKS
jgi:hypothetical protein